MYKAHNYMLIAIKEANKAKYKTEIAIGAALVFQDKIIIKGFNTNKYKKTIGHVEILILNKSIKILDRSEIQTSSIYITLEPCSICTQAINYYRLNNIIFGAYNTKNSKIDNNIQMLKKNFYKNTFIIGGLLELECSNILKNNFKFIRKNSKNKSACSSIG